MSETARMMEGLKPCPFCGQSGPTKVGYFADQLGLNFAVRCVCGVSTFNGEKEVCVRAWNTRASQGQSK